MTPPVATRPVAGWYADPAGERPLRWWDGSQWTRFVHPPVLPPLAARRVPFGARAYGYLLDAAVLWPLSLVLFHVLHRRMYDELVGVLVSTALTQGGGFPGLGTLWDYGLVQLWALTALPGVALRVAYDVWLLTRHGATWGHQRAQLVVRDVRAAAGPGRPSRPGLPWRTALVRSLVVRLAAPTVVGWLVVVLWSQRDPQGRSLADLAAGTRVEFADPTPTRGTVLDQRPNRRY